MAPLARPALPWRTTRRTPGHIPVGRPDQAAALRHLVFANAAQRSASTESPRGQSRSPERSRCPLDRDLDDSDAALDGGMRKGCYRLWARRPRSQYGAADMSCLRRAPIRGGVTTPALFFLSVFALIVAAAVAWGATVETWAQKRSRAATPGATSWNKRSGIPATAPVAQTEQLPQINRGQQSTAEAGPHHLPCHYPAGGRRVNGALAGCSP